jgi:hypothetical protein
MRTVFAALLATLLVACGTDTDPNAAQPCGLNGSCPSGFVCSPQNLCIKAGATADAGGKAPDAAAAGPDASAAAPDARAAAPDAAAGAPDAAVSGTPDATVSGTPDAAVSGTPDAGTVETADAGPNPVIVITKPAVSDLTGVNVTATFNATDATAATCTLDGHDVACTLTGVKLTGLSDGSHTLTATGTNSGVVGLPASVTWTVDASGPKVTVLTPKMGQAVASHTPSLTFSAGDATSVACTVDGASVTCDLTGRAVSPTLADGPHRFVVTAADSFGNPGGATVDFSVDTSKPVVTIDYPADGTVVCANPTLVISSTQASATLTCTYDGSPVDCAAQLDATTGTHMVTAFATSASGVMSPTESSSFTIDTAFEVAPIQVSGGKYCEVTWEIEALSTPPVGGVELMCVIDGITTQPCQLGDQFYSGDGPGDTYYHTVSVSGTDACGLKGSGDNICYYND